MELFLLLISLSIWVIGAAFETSVSGIQNKVLGGKISYLGTTTAPVLLFLFILKYTNNEHLVKPKNLKYLWIPAIITFTLAATNDFHHLIWTDFIPNHVLGIDLLIYEHGRLFWFHVIYVYLLFFTTFVILVNAIFRFRSFYSVQVYFLLVPFILAWGGNIVYLFNFDSIRGFDITPYTFSFVGIVLYWGLRKVNLLDITPVAKDLIIEKMSECLLVVNAETLFLDLNNTAIELINAHSGEKYSKKSQIIGQPVEEILKFWPEIIDKFKNENENQAEITLEDSPESRIFQLKLTGLKNFNEQLIGKMATFSDITEQKKSVESERKARKTAQALQEIALAINSSLNSEQILSTALNQIERVIPFDSASIATFGEDYIELKLIRGFNKPEVFEGFRIPLKDSPNEIIIEKKELVIYPDIQKVFPKYKDSPHNQIKSVMYIPLLNKNEVIGTLNLDSHELNHFKEEDIPAAKAFAAQVSIALENSYLFEKMSQLAVRDPLTGIYNRRYFIDSLITELNRFRRHKNPFSIILIDIDYFKRVNDTFGHLIGDQVLITVTRNCQNVLRGEDIFARYGGEEFTILLPDTQIKEAVEVAERVREVIEKNPFTFGSRTIKITASLGVSTCSTRCKSIESLLDNTDKALYQAKSNGRNCVCASGENGEKSSKQKKPLLW